MPLRDGSSWAPSSVRRSAPARRMSRRWCQRTLLIPLNCTGMAPIEVVLAQRVAVPVLGHEDAGEVGVAVEADAEHVEDLPLEGLGAGVHVEERRGHRLVARGTWSRTADAGPVAGVRQQQEHDLEPLGLDARGQVGRGEP